MSDRLNNFNIAVTQGVRAWNLAFVHPYGESYEAAYKIFNDALKSQDEVNKRNAELTILAASVVTGSLLTAVLGSTTLKIIVRNQALRTISQNNLQTTYRTIRNLATHRVSAFALGKLLDEAKNTIKSSVQSAVQKNAQMMPIRLTDTPGSMRSQLGAMLDLQALCAIDAAQAIENDGSLSEGEKEAHYGILRRAPIVVRPSGSLETSTLTNKIALSMFMNYVLDLDEVVQVPARALNTGMYGGMGVGSREVRRPISEMPGADNYPKPTAARQQGLVMSGHQYVSVREAGSEMVKKTNELHRALFNRPFFTRTGLFDRTTSSRELEDAVQVLNRLAERSRPFEAHGIRSV